MNTTADQRGTYRIGIDARLAYYQHGGISRTILELLKGLAGQDPRNVYLVLQSYKDSRELIYAPNQRKVRCLTPSHHRLERLAMAVELAPQRLDLLHSTDYIPPYKLGFRSVISVHDLTFLRYPETMTPDSRRYYAGQIEASVRTADHILASSASTRIELLDLLRVPEDKVTAVHLGVHSEFRQQPEETIQTVLERRGLPRGYLLFVGTIEPRKNINGLLQAYAILREHMPDIPPLVLVGRRGWLVDAIYQTRDDLGLANHTIWIEDAGDDIMTALYSGASVLCLPSFYEGFGFTPLEAMACGTPVVVSNRASLPEVVGDAGLLCEPDNPESIANALERLLTDSTLAEEFRKRGLRQAATFTWEKTVRSTLAVYRQVLEA